MVSLSLSSCALRRVATFFCGVAMASTFLADSSHVAMGAHVRREAAVAQELRSEGHHVTTRAGGARLQGVYLKTWSGGWSWDGIISMFTSLIGQTDIIFITFFQPTANGLDCPSQSPCAQVYSQQAGADVPAAQAYKTGVAAAASKGVRTLLSIGGWSYRDDFAVLGSMSDAQLDQWALSVKKTVDDFGAHGIDIDYEAQTAAQWENEVVKTNIIGRLRKAMPADQYVIFLTVGGIAAAGGTSEQVQAAFNPPLSTSYDLTGVALSTVKQNFYDIDRLQLMTYDGEPNFDPRVCMALTSNALQALGASVADANAKLLVGAELGDQFGSCKGNSQGWCSQDMGKITAMAQDVVQKGYGGIFFWPNVDAVTASTAFTTAYNMVKQ